MSWRTGGRTRPGLIPSWATHPNCCGIIRSKGEFEMRCPWGNQHPLLEVYHDREWGVPTRQRERLFEFLVLEGAQAGLSWLSVLKRRDFYREALQDFRPELVADFDQPHWEQLWEHSGIIKNRLKVKSLATNARQFLIIEERYGGFDRFLDERVGEGIVIHRFVQPAQVPAYDAMAESLSRDLRQLGFQFVGPTICYSFLQATGRVLDHLVDCFRYPELLPSD